MDIVDHINGVKELRLTEIERAVITHALNILAGRYPETYPETIAQLLPRLCD